MIIVGVNLWQFRDKLEVCLDVVDKRCDEIPDFFVPYLVAAEDHRSEFHQGIDQVGMLRAVKERIVNKKVQGASTIEQQFVRVVGRDYERTLLRKLREQILAVALSARRQKAAIARAYLAVAYYGTGFEGTEGVVSLLSESLPSATQIEAISIVARLKYPEPKEHIAEWSEKHSRRVVYVKSRSGFPT